MGCPCQEDCCKKADTYTPSHECDQDFCEECYATTCYNCYDKCYCDL